MNFLRADPNEHHVPWLAEYLAEYLAEFCDFKADLSHVHDDQVDPTMDAIQDLILGGLDFYGDAL